MISRKPYGTKFQQEFHYFCIFGRFRDSEDFYNRQYECYYFKERDA